MHSLATPIASGTGQLWEAAVLMAAAVVRVAPRRKKRREVPLDDRTLKDIGVEPGSITWL